jgi:hypothetical protein
MKKNTEPRHGNVRLSLEMKPRDKQAIIDHGKELGEWSLVGCLRRSVQRSKALFDLEARGTLFLQRHDDSEIEEVEIPK